MCTLIKKLLNKLNLTFLFSSFRSNIENIDTKMCSHGFQERMSSIQEQCIFVSVYGFCFDLWVSYFLLKRLCNKNCFILEWQFLGCQPMFPSLLGLQLACMQHIIYCHASPALTHAEKDTWALAQDYKLLENRERDWDWAWTNFRASRMCPSFSALILHFQGSSAETC